MKSNEELANIFFDFYGFSDQDKKILITCYKLLFKFFNDHAKVMDWLGSLNPLLGNYTPFQMVLLEKGEKLVNFIKSTLEENRRNKMPLKKGRSKKVISENIATEIREAGKSRKKKRK